jgi:hypothetical protein
VTDRAHVYVDFLTLKLFLRHGGPPTRSIQSVIKFQFKNQLFNQSTKHSIQRFHPENPSREMVLTPGVEPGTSSLPMMRSTT